VQGLSSKSELRFTFSGQWANTNLDSAEKMVAGGSASVRAYETGVVSGDSGYLGTAEFRYILSQAWGGQWQAAVFVDSSQVTVNKNVWVTGTNSATLSGAGVGLIWEGSDHWSAKAYFAKPTGLAPALVGTNRPSSQTWVEIGKGF
jgi:hemolysin activation/secretion protein